MRTARKKGIPPGRIKPYKWPPEFKRYPKTPLEDKTLMPYLIQMYNSLDERQLITKKHPAPERFHHSHAIRLNEDTNPLWYQKLCASYIVNRKGFIGKRKRMRGGKYPDTKIGWPSVQKALKNLIKNGYSYARYAEDYIEIARELQEQEKRANELSKKGRSIEDIVYECPEIMDLGGISTELRKNEDFGVAKGFEQEDEEESFPLDKDDYIPF